MILNIWRVVGFNKILEEIICWNFFEILNKVLCVIINLCKIIKVFKGLKIVFYLLFIIYIFLSLYYVNIICNMFLSI